MSAIVYFLLQYAVIVLLGSFARNMQFSSNLCGCTIELRNADYNNDDDDDNDDFYLKLSIY